MPEQDETKMVWLASHGPNTARFDGAFHFALNAPPYGRRRAPFQAPSKRSNNPHHNEAYAVRGSSSASEKSSESTLNKWTRKPRSYPSTVLLPA
jgi:hypothetical protein